MSIWLKNSNYLENSRRLLKCELRAKPFTRELSRAARDLASLSSPSIGLRANGIPIALNPHFIQPIHIQIKKVFQNET